MIVFFTDFGVNGPYCGQMAAAVYRYASDVRIINLFADAPKFNPRASAHLLASYVSDFPAEVIFVGVVDPGVGTAARKPCVLRVDGRWFVGPDNGLFDVVAARGADASWFDIIWQPDLLSASFHGRDLFAPVAGMLFSGKQSEILTPRKELCLCNGVDLLEVIYIDDFGNCITGMRAATLGKGITLSCGGRDIHYMRTFGDAEMSLPFWYENSNGLVEISVNQGCAASLLDIQVGEQISIIPPLAKRN